MKYLLIFVSLLFGNGLFAKEAIDYVDCFIGTSNSRWMLGPYAQVPFGMVQIGPDNQGNKWMGGYEYAIHSVSSFSHIHAWTMGGLSIMPTTADLALINPGPDSPYKGANAGYHSRILKETEKAFPGYYAVELYDHQVKAELTATTHCSFQKYQFPESNESRILINLQFPTEWDYGFSVKDAEIVKVDSMQLEGYADCQSGSWSSWNDYKLHFIIRFDKPFREMNGIRNGEPEVDITRMKGEGEVGAYVVFQTEKDECVQVQTALSLVDLDGARKNMEVELDPFRWDFSACLASARGQWNNLLNKIRVDGGSENDKVKFYTNLYRAYCGKQTWNDVDGRYRDAKEEIRQAPLGSKMYGGDALWNTYWNLNGLWSILTPKVIDDWVTTELEMYKHTGWTCKGPAGLEYSGIMEGSHEIALMVAAYQKGIRTDGEAIYEAIRKMVTEEGGWLDYGGSVGQIKLSYYDRFGYMPMEAGVVSKTLDYAYDDYCVAQMAKALGKKRDQKFFLKRSDNYKNVFHPELGYVVRRDSLGNWDPDFDVFSNKGFIEGNSWQYSWYVPHDIQGAIELMGGKEVASARLLEGFQKSERHNFAAHAFDRTSGQRAEYYINQGNEVNMSAAFIFNYLDQPWLCQKYSRAILKHYYGSTPYHGWEGDEDEGQMGGWFVMSALGFFEMDGGVSANSWVELTSPLFSNIEIDLDNTYYGGGKFIVEALNNSDENIYIQSAYLNGKRLKEPRILFKDIVGGGKLVLQMGKEPNTDW